MARLLPTVYQPKGKAGLESLLLVSVVGPIGQPTREAMYPPITTEDGSPMNASHDYVISMTKDELPPANAFWSFTLYDEKAFSYPTNTRNTVSVKMPAGDSTKTVALVYMLLPQSQQASRMRTGCLSKGKTKS